MLRILAAGVVLLGLAPICPTPSLAHTWPRFRGPNGCGEADAASIPVRWTDQDYLWSKRLPGVGHSSPVVWEDRLVVTSGIEKDATLVVYCLRTSDGGEIWKRELPGNPHAKNKANSYASSTPALDGRQAYVTWLSGQQYVVAALSLEDGREVWRRELGPFLSEHGFGASPMIWEDLVIVPNDQDGPSFVHALERATGKTRWQAERRTQKAAFATPCIFQGEDGKPQLILSSWANGVTSLDPASGRKNWELALFQNRVVGSPLPAAGSVFAAAGTGGIGRQFLAIRPPGPEQGQQPKVAYQVQPPLPYVPTPVAKGDLVFLWHDRGVVMCLDGPSGKVHWRERIGGGDYFSSPVRAGDRLYGISRAGEMIVLAASDRYELLARFPLGDRCHSTPAVADNVMYLRTFSRVMAIAGDKKP